MFSRYQLTPDLTQQSFEQVIVDLDDGNQFLMSKCLNCAWICRNNARTKHAHWKRCPSKFLFKYINQNESSVGCVTVCTMCKMTFMSPDIITMKTHYQKCFSMVHQPTNSVSYTFGSSYASGSNSFDTNGTSNVVKNIHENIVNRQEIEAQRKVVMAKSGKFPTQGFKIKYISNENGPERYSECLACKTLFKKPTNNTLTAHRLMCSYPTNVLMSVSTQSVASQPFTSQSYTSHSLNSHQHLAYHPMSPYARPVNSMDLQPAQSHQMPPHTVVSQQMASQPFESTITDSMFTISENTSRSTPQFPVKICFICNTRSSKTFVNLYQTTSSHSNTKIYDFVWQFLGDQPSVRDNSADAANSNCSLVCNKCLDLINEYDFHKVLANKHENCLRDKLSQTEMYYVKLRGVLTPTESPTIRGQREREQLHSNPNKFNITGNVNGHRYADEPDDAVHYLVELSDEECGEKEGVKHVESIELSDDEDA